MKDFAKSIRTGNSYTKGQVLVDEEGKKYVFGGEINGTYIVHRQPDGKTFSFSSEQEIKDWMRNSKIGNSKVGNDATVLKDGDVWVVLYANETKSKEFDTEAEAISFAKQVGNSKVGNREISLSASNSGELNLYDDGTGFMYDPVELGRYDIKGKSDAMATVRELEKLKREAEAKLKDCQKFIDTLKQWANGLK